MTSFCKSGMLVLKDQKGMFHFFDPGNSLRDVAKYIWNNPSLKLYQTEGNFLEGDKEKSTYVEINKEREHRLRSSLSLYDDTYYMDVAQ